MKQIMVSNRYVWYNLIVFHRSEWFHTNKTNSFKQIDRNLTTGNNSKPHEWFWKTAVSINLNSDFYNTTPTTWTKPPQGSPSTRKKTTKFQYACHGVSQFRLKHEIKFRRKILLKSSDHCKKFTENQVTVATFFISPVIIRSWQEFEASLCMNHTV